jgi:two-component system copper resistance phosphate regulon response regulator CusR
MLEAPPQSSYSLHLADLELDLLRGRAIRNREVLRLTPKEFALLAFLMQRPGEVYDAWQLAEQVWGMQLSVFERKNPKSHAVAIAVRRLRRKIDAGRTPRLLHTLRGGAYMLAALD